MLEYMHFVPGRLRLKITALRHQRRAAEAKANVAAIPMVTGVVANAMTGSLTINFDRRQLSIGDLWERLRALGYVPENCPEPMVAGCAAIDGPDADRFRAGADCRTGRSGRAAFGAGPGSRVALGVEAAR